MNSLLPNALFTIHQGKSGGRGLSPRLWARASGQMLSPDGASNSVFVGDDFTNFSGFSPATAGTSALPSATVPGPNGYGLYIDVGTAAGSIANVAAEDYGVCRIATPAQDNHESWLAAQGNVGTFGSLSTSAPRLTIFEARVRFSSVADDVGSFFVGLGQTAFATADAKVDNTGVMADRNFLGFNTVHTNGGTAGTNALLRSAYRRTGQTQQNVGSNTVVANTWYKLGFVYDPASTSERLQFFIDNVRVATVVANDVNAVAGSLANTFPNARMTFVAGVKNGSAAVASLDMDWWAFFQGVS
jgi:hypothetical protein